MAERNTRDGLPAYPATIVSAEGQAFILSLIRPDSSVFYYHAGARVAPDSLPHSIQSSAQPTGDLERMNTHWKG